MQIENAPPTVPASHPLAAGQRDTPANNRDSLGTNSGTVSLKALANKILAWDNTQVCNETRAKSSVPPTKSAVGRLPEHWHTSEWREYFDERAGIAEHCGELTRQEAEAMAYEGCIVRWLNSNPANASNNAICPHCAQPNGSPGESCIPVLNGKSHTWIHHNCHESWMKARRTLATKKLLEMGISYE